MQRSLRSRPTFLMFVLLTTLGLAGCRTTSTQDTQSAPPLASATIAAPAKAPTHAAATFTPGKRIKNTPGNFDFYMMALSWSPDYCAGNDDPQQCSVGKKLGFVLHGLWPQYNRGYPTDCSNVKLPKNATAHFPNLYPSTSLYTHEWDRHGTCSGLTPVEYMTLAKTLKDSIAIPTAYRQPAKAFRTTVDDLKSAFVQANSTQSEDALAVQCSGSGRFLQELYVCFSRAGQPVACSAELQKNEANSCRNVDFLVRNVK